MDKLEKDVPDEAAELSKELYSLLPRIKLPELLIEVSNWTGFDRPYLCINEKSAKERRKTDSDGHLNGHGNQYRFSKDG